MHTPRGGEDGRSRVSTTTGRQGAVGAVEHSASCVAGFVATSALALLFYPVLVEVTHSLRALSSTAIVLVLVFAWLLVWLAIEILWEWRAGRVRASG